MSDLIEWLRHQDKTYGAEQLGQAADEIETLRAQLTAEREISRKLYEALKKVDVLTALVLNITHGAGEPEEGSDGWVIRESIAEYEAMK